MVCKQITVSLSLCLLFFVSCAEQVTTRTDFALGTVCSVTIFEKGQTGVCDEIFSRIREIENLMSVNISSSDVSRVNAAAGIAPVQVQEDTFKVIERAIYFAELSGGEFDPTVGPIVSLWGIGSRPRVPSNEEINEALPLINWRNIEMDARSKSVYLTHNGMALDLGGIAKGYAADEAVKIIKSSNINSAKIDLGGNIILLGIRRDKKPWKVGIQNPDGRRGSIIGVLQIPEKTVVTSGVYERNFEKDGVLYHHLLSVTDGYPVNNGLVSVTIIADVSMDADALSTAVFVSGYEKGISILKNYGDARAVFVFEDKSVIATPGCDFTLTDKKYSMAAMKE
ncbi:thiamine biosynthesis lipoprotein ApbE [Treponema sp. R8-4-B8]